MCKKNINSERLKDDIATLKMHVNLYKEVIELVSV